MKPTLAWAVSRHEPSAPRRRNRIKRLTRESFRLNQHSLPPVDVTVSAREAARQATPGDLRASLDKHWKSITQRC
jgi:ribonuclease P protein component